MARDEAEQAAYPLDVATRGRPGARAPMSSRERWGAVFEYLLAVYKNTWRGSVFGRFMSPLLFLLAMGVGLGSLVDERAGGVDGQSYLHFVVPAIVATQAMWLAMSESTYPVYGAIRWNMAYHAMLATPLGVRDVLLGQTAAIAFHLTMSTAIFLGVAALFGGFVSWWAVLCLPIGVLTGLAFVLPLIGITARAESEETFNLVFRIVMTPLMLFSGTFFPISQLPIFLQPIAWVTPLWHGVEACRAAALGRIEPLSFGLHIAALLLFCAVGWVWARRGMERRLVV
ncbi:ABC transporter permease [Actinomycetota bacterium]